MSSESKKNRSIEIKKKDAQIEEEFKFESYIKRIAIRFNNFYVLKYSSELRFSDGSSDSSLTTQEIKEILKKEISY